MVEMKADLTDWSKAAQSVVKKEVHLVARKVDYWGLLSVDAKGSKLVALKAD
jgi:hypothetical protein